MDHSARGRGGGGGGGGGGYGYKRNDTDESVVEGTSSRGGVRGGRLRYNDP